MVHIRDQFDNMSPEQVNFNFRIICNLRIICCICLHWSYVRRIYYSSIFKPLFIYSTFADNR